MTVNVVSRAAVVLVLIIIGMAMLLGFQAANAPAQWVGVQATVEAGRMQRTQQALEIEARQTQIAIEADQRKARATQEFEHQRALDDQELDTAQRRAQLVDVLLAVLATILGIAILLVALAAAVRLLRAAPAARPAPDLRDQLRAAARANELLERQLAELRATRPVVPGANGQHKSAAEPTRTGNKDYGSGEPAITVRP